MTLYNIHNKLKSFAILAISLFLLFSLTPNLFPSKTMAIDLYSVSDSKPYGLSYEDHVINYNKFILSLPLDTNPSTDETGERCTIGQDLNSSSVFYITGGSGGSTMRTCHVPPGVGLFIPMIEVEASTGEVPGATIDRLHQIAQKDQDNVKSLHLKINGSNYNYEDLKKFRIHTQDFDVDFPQNALFGANPGPSKVVADGHYVITSPLTQGKYTIQFGGSLVCLEADCLEPTFATNTTYNLIVE
jgi:hypothetical protein